MATLEDRKNDIAISSDALSLLDCFSSDFEDVIFRLAAHAARARAGGNAIEVVPSDIQAAAEAFATIMKASQLPDDVKAEVDMMLQCVSAKHKRRK
jgi:hypothetical protein